MEGIRSLASQCGDVGQGVRCRGGLAGFGVEKRAAAVGRAARAVKARSTWRSGFPQWIKSNTLCFLNFLSN